MTPSLVVRRNRPTSTKTCKVDELIYKAEIKTDSDWIKRSFTDRHTAHEADMEEVSHEWDEFNENKPLWMQKSEDATNEGLYQSLSNAKTNASCEG